MFEALTFLTVLGKDENVGKDLKAFEYHEYTSALSFPTPVSFRNCSESNLSPNMFSEKFMKALKLTVRPELKMKQKYFFFMHDRGRLEVRWTGHSHSNCPISPPKVFLRVRTNILVYTCLSLWVRQQNLKVIVD